MTEKIGLSLLLPGALSPQDLYIANSLQVAFNKRQSERLELLEPMPLFREDGQLLCGTPRSAQDALTDTINQRRQTHTPVTVCVGAEQIKFGRRLPGRKVAVFDGDIMQLARDCNPCVGPPRGVDADIIFDTLRADYLVTCDDNLDLLPEARPDIKNPNRRSLPIRDDGRFLGVAAMPVDPAAVKSRDMHPRLAICLPVKTDLATDMARQSALAEHARHYRQTLACGIMMIEHPHSGGDYSFLNGAVQAAGGADDIIRATGQVTPLAVPQLVHHAYPKCNHLLLLDEKNILTTRRFDRAEPHNAAQRIADRVVNAILAPQPSL